MVFVILLASASPPAWAQASTAPLTLDDCIRLAQGAASLAGVARQETQIADLGVRQAKAGFLPRSQFDAGFTYNSPLQSDTSVQSYVALNGVREHSYLLTALQEIDTSGRLRAELARARAERDAAGANVTITQRDVKRAVTAAYYQLLLTRHLADALRDSLAEAESFEQRTRLLLANGEAAQADLIKASAEVAQLRQAQNAAQLDAELANQELASFWTANVAEPLRLVDIFEQPPAPPAFETFAAAAGTSPFLKRPEFSLLDAERRGFLAESRRARAELFPQAGLGFQYGLDSNFVRARDRGYAIFVSLSVPVFDWFRTLNTSKQFRVQAEQTDTRRALAERLFSRDYASAQSRVRKLFDQIALAAEQVRLAQEDLRLSRIRFEGGEGSAVDVVTAQNQLAQARANYYLSLANYWNARADREVAVGQ
jgi:outer membrane protein